MNGNVGVNNVMFVKKIICGVLLHVTVKKESI